ncbi:bifunctional 5,10-methylenetetrahydrofolate dehydrogenase/5,10-methenyltetrahydrofolate cyclohydrolase [Candidatus Collierbacteria bacterium]|nr:bifunctional 5,10-methylenetetrahydrofolate dehydrogenase/5,10-methenyltetrahydrofolate cyclohydrolase [Candidatus Collierbacteria bacterium]
MIIDGKKLAAEREKKLAGEVSLLTKKIGRRPKLLAVELADDEGSRLYLKLKRKAAERLGIEFEVIKRPGLSGKGLAFLTGFDIDGVFVQHPRGYDKQKWQELVDQIPPEKDVDCLTSENLQLIKDGKPRFLPATVKAVGYVILSVVKDPVGPNPKWDSSVVSLLQNDGLLRHFLLNKHVVILGRSPILGLPLFWWFNSFGGKVTLLHSQTKNKKQKTKNSDILISSVGKPGIIIGKMVKEGAIVVDCGSPSGDVAFGEVAPKASAITPVPGGVGPLTVVSLMENVVKSAKDTYAKKRR